MPYLRIAEQERTTGTTSILAELAHPGRRRGQIRMSLLSCGVVLWIWLPGGCPEVPIQEVGRQERGLPIWRDNALLVEVAGERRPAARQGLLVWCALVACLSTLVDNGP